MLKSGRSASKGVLEIVPKRFGDARGFFSETYNAERFAQAGIDLVFVQDNHSFSADAGVLRGLHYQLAPSAQDKLVRVMRGCDPRCRGRHPPRLADLRKMGRARSFGRKWNQILVPKGFAHGFVTLVPDTEVLYKVTDTLFAGA